MQNNFLFDLFNRTQKTNEIKDITVEQAMQIPTFAACIDLICSSIASLQIKLYEQQGDNIIEIKDDPRLEILNNQTGDLLNAYDMKYMMVQDYLLKGDGHAYINKKRNNVESLHYVDTRYVIPREGFNPIFKDIKIMVQGEEYEEYDFINLARNTINGVEGIGMVEEHNKILTLAYNQLNFESKLIGKGGFKRGVLTSDVKLSRESIDKLKEDWKSLDEELMVLNKGLGLNDLQQTSVELQLNESKKINSDEICKLSLVPIPVLMGTATDSIYNHFVNIKLVPILSKFQANINRSMLQEKEKKNESKKWFAFDMKNLYKGDLEKQFRAYEIALKNGFMTIDEVRYREDLSNLELNFLKMSLGEILYNIKTKEVYTPNTDKTSTMGSNIIEKEGEKNENRDKE